jgi:hypothetical protein
VKWAMRLAKSSTFVSAVTEDIEKKGRAAKKNFLKYCFHSIGRNRILYHFKIWDVETKTLSLHNLMV